MLKKNETFRAVDSPTRHHPHQFLLELIHVSPIERLNNPSMHTLWQNFPPCHFFRSLPHQAHAPIIFSFSSYRFVQSPKWKYL